MKSIFSLLSRKKTWTFYPQFRPTKRIDRSFDLNSVSRMFKQKLPFLNLSGLAGLKGLVVHVISEPSLAESYKSHIQHSICVYHAGEQSEAQPNVILQEDRTEKKLTVTSFYPDLPADQHFGMTVFFLILTRGNGFAKRTVDIETAQEAIQKMTDHMKGFDVQTDWTGEAR